MSEVKQVESLYHRERVKRDFLGAADVEVSLVYVVGRHNDFI